MSADDLKARRNNLYKLIQIGCTQLGLDNDTMREMFFTVTRKRSRTDMDLFELNRVISHLTSRGFVIESKRGPIAKVKYDPETQAALIRNLWTDLSEVGKVKDASDTALRAWVVNQSAAINNGVGISDARMLPVKMAQRLIERLKKWLARKQKVGAAHV